MLARLAREIPRGDYLYEPKWDGFRALVFRDRDDVDIRSRHDRPLARYFPELVGAFRALARDALVVDGESVIVGPAGFDFAAVMLRLHPSASRVERLARETPASFIAFDLLAEGDTDLRERAFGERRARLERVLAAAPAAMRLSPATREPRVALEWLARATGGGADGIVAKPLGEPYRAGTRAMTKVKTERTADCVVGGMRLLADGASLGSLVLGLYDDAGAFRHVGVIVSFSDAVRRELPRTLAALVVDLAGHPWAGGFGIGRSPVGRLGGSAGRWDPATMVPDWIPLRPELVVEVAYDTLDGERFRHPARFRRWRPDREPRSCGFDQLATAPAPSIAELLRTA